MLNKITTNVVEAIVNDHVRVNNYTLTRILGSGSYGEVVLCYDNAQPQRPLAMKVLSKKKLEKQREISQKDGQLQVMTGLDRVQLEILSLYLLGDHENVTSIHEVISDPQEDDLYIVIDFIESGVVMKWDPVDCSFSGRHGEHSFVVETVRQLMWDLLRGLRFIHSRGIAHRDIKPDNLFVSESGVLRIGDFGVSKIFPMYSSSEIVDLQNITYKVHHAVTGNDFGKINSEPLREFLRSFHQKPGSKKNFDLVFDTSGTFFFLPPEACGDGGYSAFAADVWAAGVCMYVFLFGVVPFGRECRDPMSLFDAIVSEPLLPLPFHLAARPPSLRKDSSCLLLLQGLLEKNPKKRLSLEAALQHSFFLPIIHSENRIELGSPTVAGCPPTFIRARFAPLDIEKLSPYTSIGLHIEQASRRRSSLSTSNSFSSRSSMVGINDSAQTMSSPSDFPLASTASEISGCNSQNSLSLGVSSDNHPSMSTVILTPFSHENPNVSSTKDVVEYNNNSEQIKPVKMNSSNEQSSAVLPAKSLDEDSYLRPMSADDAGKQIMKEAGYPSSHLDELLERSFADKKISLPVEPPGVSSDGKIIMPPHISGIQEEKGLNRNKFTAAVKHFFSRDHFHFTNMFSASFKRK